MPLPPERFSLKEEDRAYIRRIIKGETIPAPAHGSEKLRNVVLKACVYDACDRYAAVEDMLSDLRSIRDDNELGRRKY